MTRKRLSDVAAKVGVSEATVSRVLNGKSGVSHETRAAVLTALDVLGYERPTQLRGERNRLVGLVLPELQNPIFPAYADVIGNVLAQRGFTPVLCTRTAGGVAEAEYVELLLEQQVSGVVFVGGLYAHANGSHGHFEQMRRRRLPAVLINAAVPGIGFPAIVCDDAVAAQRSFDHLHMLGHRRVGLVLGSSDHVPSQRKLSALQYAAAQVDTAVTTEDVQYTMFSLEGGQAAAERLLERGCTALVCASDLLALGVIRAARRRGLKVPGDVSVIGFDDSALMAAVDPPLTTVRQPIEAMGAAAVDVLVSQIAGEPAPPDELLFEPELVVRGSTAPPPV